jgi:hypothetical protein
LNGLRNIICCKNKIRGYSYNNLLKIVVRIDTAYIYLSKSVHKVTVSFSLTFNVDWFLSQNIYWGLSWSWSYGSWIYNYLCNQCLSPLQLWVRIPLRRSVLDTLCDKVFQWLGTGRWFSPPIKLDCHDITVLLPVTYLESSSTAWITAVANVYTTESRIINVWYGVPLSLIPNLSLKYPYLV